METVTAADWAALDASMAGSVLLPGAAAFAGTKRLFDTRFDALVPAAVVRVASTQDVSRALVFAAAHDLRVAPRCGGHSYIGASSATGALVLDLRLLRSTTYEPATGRAVVAAGAPLYAVHTALAAHGRTIPTGTCPTVGVAGITLGGGVGVESREWGLTCDRLLGVRAVLPDGRSVTATPTQNADLFWAFRGLGGGNLAVATAFTFATHPATTKGTFVLDFPSSSARQVLTGWARWIAATARTRWANVHVDSLGGGSVACRVVGVTAAGDERAAGASLATAIGVAPTHASYAERGYLATVAFLGGGTTSSPRGFVAGSDVLASMSATTADAIVGAVRARSAAGRGGAAILDPLTGRVGDVATAATAFPWRDHLASVQWYTDVTSASGYASADAWVADAHRRVGAASAGGYVNYLEAGTSPHHYLSSNATRLPRLRRTYDPTWLIRSGLTAL